MSRRNILDIAYGTGNLRYDSVRKGFIQNLEKLTELGYGPFAWKGDLDLKEMPSEGQLIDKGYIQVGNVIVTQFEKSGLPFTISIFPKSQRAKIFGENHVYSDEFDEVKRDFNELEKVTGIHMSLEVTKEYPED
jgi:hypothetical protein